MKDISYGIIPIYQRTNWELKFLLINQVDWDHWCFPKGHPERGEVFEDTAQRELREETNIKQIDLDKEKAFQEDYVFTRGVSKIEKTVRYYIGYLMEHRSCVKLQEDEVKDFQRLSYEEAKEKITYLSLKNMFVEVGKYLELE